MTRSYFDSKHIPEMESYGYSISFPQIKPDDRPFDEQWANPLKAMEYGYIKLDFLDGTLTHTYPLTFDNVLQIAGVIARYDSCFLATLRRTGDGNAG